MSHAARGETRNGGVCWRSFTYYEPLRRVRSHLLDNIADPLPLSEAARVAGFQKSYFSTYFHDKVGVRFRDWVSLERIEAAKRIFESRDARVTEVCYEVGFGCLRAFERAFSKWAGLLPKDFRNHLLPDRSG